MATRSTIALEYADGTVDQVYCHWDGYLEHNGQILQDNYTDPFKLRDLIDLGDISSLGPNIGEKHDFEIAAKYGTPEYEAASEAKRQVCTFYMRDRGESNQGAKRFADFSDYKNEHQYEEYEYILRRDGNWYVSAYSKEYVLLTAAIAAEAAAA
jgi:hypothetical protein